MYSQAFCGEIIMCELIGFFNTSVSYVLHGRYWRETKNQKIVDTEGTRNVREASYIHLFYSYIYVYIFFLRNSG